MNITLENMIVVISAVILFSMLGYLNYRATMNRVESMQAKMGILNKKLTETKHS